MIGSILGNSVRRVEDPRFLRGTATYVEDLSNDEALHAVFVRSFLAHARITGIDDTSAKALPGVAAVYTATDLDLPPMPPLSSVAERFARPLLARDVVRFVGEAVAVVLATTRAEAVDAAEAVVLDYEPLPVVVDPIRAVEPGATILFPDHGSNVALDTGFVSMPRRAGADPLAGADVVIRARFVNQRVAPVPMEVNGALAAFDPDTDGVTLWVPSQAPFAVRTDVARGLGLDESQVHVIAPAVGGGFGAKGDTYPEWILLAALAHRLTRPVRYVETRSENMTAMVHGRAQVQDVEIGARRDGTIVGLRADVIADMGAYPMGAYLPELTRMMACGVYRIPRVQFRSRCVLTNTTPVGAYRGAGRPEAAALIERAMDMVADELDMDPIELRRRNLIPPEAFPHTTASGGKYDTGDYDAALTEALRTANYEELRAEQAARRARGDRFLLGIGVSCYVEITGFGSEFGSVEVHDDGSVTVLTGTSPHGQGHETAWAQIVAGTLGVSFERIRVVHSDTDLVPSGEGTMGSRSAQMGGSAVLRASEGVLDKARLVAAHALEAAVEDIALTGDARIGVSGAPDRSLSWAELAAIAADPGALPASMEPGLLATADFEQGGSTYPFGAHVAVVDVDAQTGRVRLVRHIAVDDCGRIINPLLVDGQVHGGVAQGVAQALFEEATFDEAGTPLNASLMSYAMPSAAELPFIEVRHTTTPTPMNPLGAKGIGEAGTIGSTPAVQNAVVDALSHLGVRHLDMPLTPERVWRAIRESTEVHRLR
jgi:carbon-monoxide dehydrogenase large subunit